MKLQVTVDSDTCIGTGNCVFNAPGVFEQDDDGTSHVVDQTAASEETIRFAAGTCPVSAIDLTGAADRQ